MAEGADTPRARYPPNDLLIALIFAGRDSQPLTVALQQQTRSFGSSVDVISAGSFLSLIVPLAVFFGFPRYFVQGVLAGSVKRDGRRSRLREQEEPAERSRRPP